MGTLTVITAPVIDPISVDEVKQALRIEDGDDDTLLLRLIKDGSRFVEKYCSTYLMSQTIELSFDSWPSSIINLGIWPLQSIDSVVYDDTASPIVEQTLVEDTDYYADIKVVGG